MHVMQDESDSSLNEEIIMFSRKYNLMILYFTVCVFFCSILLSGCGTTYRYSYPGHKTFTEENIALLRVGMSSEQVLSIFGNPDEQYVGQFGADVGEKWNGRVWVYFTKLDPRLKHAKRYMKNVFVFHPTEGDIRLNHWEIEKEK